MIKKGDKIYCHSPVIMTVSGRHETTKGKYYVVTSVHGYGFWITNDSGQSHQFRVPGVDTGDGNTFSNWFTTELIPKSIKTFSL